MVTKQSNENFLQLKAELKSEYERQEREYGWKFNQYEDQSGEIKGFIITNKIQATKVLFNEPAKIITRTNIYRSDIEIITKLQESI